MLYVTRRETFSASHRLTNPSLSDAQNDALFGKCNNPNGHGHNYELEVTVCGDVAPETGYVIDLKVLKEIIRREVIVPMDHKHLNYDVPILSGINPTTENIARVIWKVLAPKIPTGRLYSVRLRETENHVVEYRGES
jgi:6-pyruvoyltetrahydropterin/6-carboxytetrahydropterin synthase